LQINNLINFISEGIAVEQTKQKIKDTEDALARVTLKIAECKKNSQDYSIAKDMLKTLRSSWFILSFDEKNIFVSKETYENMVSIMYGMDYNEFVKQYLEKSDMGIGMIDKIIVYVDDIADVKSIAKVIADIGYNPSYALNAFDNLTTSLQTSKIIGFIVMFAFFIITIINMNNAYDMYLRNSQKDIGILKHYGYSEKMILSIYMKNFRNILYMTFGIISALTVVAAFLLMKSYIYIFPCISMLIVIIVMFVLLMIVYLISRRNAKKIINKNVLVLVKFSKENE
jgi:hypothetical protein